jgi:hypothetical protein
MARMSNTMTGTAALAEGFNSSEILDRKVFIYRIIILLDINNL